MAQLGARLNGIQKVRGSNPLSSTSTIKKPSGDPGGFFRCCLSLIFYHWRFFIIGFPRPVPAHFCSRTQFPGLPDFRPIDLSRPDLIPPYPTMGVRGHSKQSWIPIPIFTPKRNPSATCCWLIYPINPIDSTNAFQTVPKA